MVNRNIVNGNQNSQNSNKKNKSDEQLIKAELFSIDGKDYDFEFMFNPNELDINKKAAVTENRGARSAEQGIPKVSFAHPEATTIKINNIIFDVYEMKDRDLGKYLSKLLKTVQFVKGKNRPPIYIFRWGKINYLRCFIESVNYKLTYFLPDGRPMRANASINLKEVDPSFGESNPPANTDPDTRERMSRWNQEDNWFGSNNNNNNNNNIVSNKNRT